MDGGIESVEFQGAASLVKLDVIDCMILVREMCDLRQCPNDIADCYLQICPCESFIGLELLKLDSGCK